MSKKKIINDPVYGFIPIYDELIFDIIEHPYFQRLRRIKQLGMTDLVYPGAHHTRFHHAIGAMYLMSIALQNLRSKGHEITDEEYQGALIAILLHDIGHGPFSHALEHSILSGVPHEAISSIFMERLNTDFKGKLTLALQIFKNQHPKQFLSQLVSSQLDIDRMDYLQRDCYFTGVSEGTIGAHRIIKMLEVVDNKLVVEEKGIYSIENFLNARRLMYWQVYLHKTAISAEQMLIQIFNRAKKLAQTDQKVFGSPSLIRFLNSSVDLKEFNNNSEHQDHFALLDDYDIWGAIKIWQSHYDKVLSNLSQRLLNRRLLKVKLSNDPWDEKDLIPLRQNLIDEYRLTFEEASCYIITGSMSNEAYISKGKNINILTKKGELIDVAEASDLPNIRAISKIVKKYYLCWPKGVTL